MCEGIESYIIHGVPSSTKKSKEHDRTPSEVDASISCKIDCFIINYISEISFPKYIILSHSPMILCLQKQLEIDRLNTLYLL